MKKICFVYSLSLMLICLMSFAASAATNEFLGISFDSTAEQSTKLIKLAENFRPVPNIQYYRTDNEQINGKDIGSVYFGFHKDTGKFGSADFILQFFDAAKRSKAIKREDGAYIFMGQASLAEPYFEALCAYFDKNFGKHEIKEGGMENQSFFKEARWNAKISSGRLTVSLSYGRPKEAPMSYISGVILLHK